MKTDKVGAEGGAQPDRTPQDYAIEHAGYLADAAQAYLDEKNRHDMAAAGYGDEVPDTDSLSDHHQALRDAIYEFCERAAKVREVAKHQAQDMCPICGHEWSRHDPEDGQCDAGPPCGCGRNLEAMQARIAELSSAAIKGMPAPKPEPVGVLRISDETQEVESVVGEVEHAPRQPFAKQVLVDVCRCGRIDQHKMGPECSGLKVLREAGAPGLSQKDGK